MFRIFTVFHLVNYTWLHQRPAVTLYNTKILIYDIKSDYLEQHKSFLLKIGQFARDMYQEQWFTPNYDVGRLLYGLNCFD